MIISFFLKFNFVVFCCNSENICSSPWLVWAGKKHSYYNLCLVMSSRGKVIGRPGRHYECKKLQIGRLERVVSAFQLTLPACWLYKRDVRKILS